MSRTIPFVIANAVLSLWQADSGGNADVSRPVFLGARTERFRALGRIEEFEFTGSGDPVRDYGQYGEEHELGVAQIFCVDGRTWSDFELKRGRYVLEVYWQDPRSRVFYRRTYYGVQTKERSESGDQGQQYFIQEKLFRSLFMVANNGQLGPNEDTRAGVPGSGNPTSTEDSYLSFHSGPVPAGDTLAGQFQFTTAMRLTYAKVVAAAGSVGTATVLRLEGNGTPLLTLTLPAGSGEQSAATASDFTPIDIAANTLLRWRVVSGPADVEDLAEMISATMNLVSLDSVGATYSGTPPPTGGGGSGGSGGSVVAGAITDRKDFVVPSQTWTWVHGLGYRPVVQVFDTDGNELPLAEVQYVDANTVVAGFAVLRTGFMIIVH